MTFFPYNSMAYGHQKRRLAHSISSSSKGRPVPPLSPKHPHLKSTPNIRIQSKPIENALGRCQREKERGKVAQVRSKSKSEKEASQRLLRMRG